MIIRDNAPGPAEVAFLQSIRKPGLPCDHAIQAHQSLYNKLVSILAALVFLLGLCGLAGYLFGIMWLRTFSFSVPMDPAVGGGFMALGVAMKTILDSKPYDEKPKWLWPLRWLSLLISVCVGLYNIFLYFGDPRFNFWDLTVHAILPVAFLSAFVLTFSALALGALMLFRNREPVVVYLVGIPSLLILNLGIMALIGYIHQVPLLYGFKMALPAALAAFFTGLALNIGTLPFRGLLTPLLSDRPKARILAWLSVGLGLGILVFWLNHIGLDLRYYNIQNTADLSDDLKRLLTSGVYTACIASVLINTFGLRATRYFSESLFYARVQEQAAMREAVMRRITQAIHASLELEDIFQVIADSCGHYLKADRCFISLYDAETKRLIPPTREFLSSSEVGSMLIVDPELWKRSKNRLAEQICLLRRPMEFNRNTMSVYKELEIFLENTQIQSGLGCAIFYRDTPLAVFFIHQVLFNRVWTQDEKDFAQAVADQAAIAIYQSKLYQQERQVREKLDIRAREQEIVADLGLKAASVMDLQAMLDETVQRMAGVLDVEYCNVLEFLPDGQEFLLRAGVGWEEGYVGNLRIGQGVSSQAGYTLLLNQPVIVEDLPAETRFHPPPLLVQRGIASGVSAPIRGTEKPWGVLSAHTTRLRKFSQDDVNFIRAVANLLAVTIERKQVELALRESRHKLEQSNKDLEQFAAMASHDLQAPLRKIRAFSEKLIQDSQSSLNAEDQKLIERIHSSIIMAQDLISDLLALSTIEKTGQPFQKVDLTQLLPRVLVNLDDQIRIKDADIQYGPLSTVMGDPRQLEMLFQNLIENALKYQPQDQKDQKPVIRIYADKADGDFCGIVIEDNGIGFAPEFAERIFLPFERLHGRASPYSGTGIGLAICKRIVERHGGTIKAESQEGKGSRFIVHIPYKGKPPEEREAAVFTYT